MASSAPNALSFGDDIIGGAGTNRSTAEDNAARGIAIAAVTFCCLLHSFTRRGGILLNNIVVVIKLLILCSFPILAFCALGGVADTNYAKANMGSNTFADAHSNVDGYVQGTLAILFAYNGYNQANYVSSALARCAYFLTNSLKVLCEINRPRKTLVKGIIIAVATICVLYMLVNISYVRLNHIFLHGLLQLPRH
jgi:amino acid transporter